MKRRIIVLLTLFLMLFSFCSDNRNSNEIYRDVVEDFDKLPEYAQLGIVCPFLNEKMWEEARDPSRNDDYKKFLVYYDDEGNLLDGETAPSDDEMYMLKNTVSEDFKRQYKKELFIHVKFYSSDIYWENCVSMDSPTYWIDFDFLTMNIADLLEWGYITPYEICNYSRTAHSAADNVLYNQGSSCSEFVDWKG